MRLKLGTRVRITHQPDRDRGYIEGSRARRAAGNGLTGVAIAEHDSHGLCYEVQIEDGIVITYDREELEDIDDRIDAWHRGNSKQPLHEFLGMSEEEYAAWVVGTPPEKK